MYVDRHKIPYQHWSMKVARQNPETGETPDPYGQIVVALDDLHQAIHSLLLTWKGSVPTEPEKGLAYDGVIDKHPDFGIPLLTREIWDQIGIWEPRITVKNVEVVQIAFAHFAAKIFWRPVESLVDDLQITEVTLNA